MISALILLPLLAAILILILPDRLNWSQPLTAIVNLVQLALVISMGVNFPDTDSFSFVENFSWFHLALREGMTLRAEYFVGVDGLSFPLIGLNVVIQLVATLASQDVTHRPKSFFILLLILNAALIGCFSALDLLLFFLFFEFMLVPLYFLIGIWGGPQREYAAVKFFLFTFVGSIFILLGFIAISISSRVASGEELVHTFSIIALQQADAIASDSMMDASSIVWNDGFWGARTWIFLLLLTGFSIKIPVVPLHTWLPVAHVEASTPVSIVLAAVVLKVGAYGLFRFTMPLFPQEMFAMSAWIAGAAVLSIVYGALNAMASKDLKRLIAYSSVSHMGFVLLGLISATAAGVNGAVFQMISHGILSAALFLLAGILYTRTHDRNIENYSGLSTAMPTFATFTLIAFVASLGMPGLSGFIGEMLVLTGSIGGSISGWMISGVAFGLILTAGYFIWTYQRLFMGSLVSKVATPSELLDLTKREIGLLTFLLALSFLFGLWPQALLHWTEIFSESWVSHMRTLLTPH